MKYSPLGLIILVLALTACSSPAPTKELNMPTIAPLVIAHRGARSLAPENTLAAARQALAVGADMWELDVSVTADGQLVIMHDDTLDRTSDVRQVFPGRIPWRVWEFTLIEIQQLDCGSWFNQSDPFGQIAAGQVSADDVRAYVGEPTPTLRQALEFTRDNHWRVNVELKSQPNADLNRIIVQETVTLIHELGMDDGQQVVVSSFDHDYLKAIHAANPQIPIQALTNQKIPNLASYLAALGTDTCNPKAGVWSPQELGEFSNAGIHFNVWTVNDEGLIKELAQAGVQGIITDFPQTMVALFQQPNN